MNVKQLNQLYEEFRHRFDVECRFLMSQTVFCEIAFKNHQVLFPSARKGHMRTLEGLLQCSMEGLALALSRLWDQGGTKSPMLSLPDLVAHFSQYKYLGFIGLGEGKPERLVYENLKGHPLKARLRVARTELLAHSLIVGQSRDRKKSDLIDEHSFLLVNDEVIKYAYDNIRLLEGLLKGQKKKGRGLEEQRALIVDQHLKFFERFDPQICISIDG